MNFELAPHPADRAGIASHPEEMRANFNMRIGEHITLQGSARWTPAGVVTAGIMATGVLLAIAAIVKAARGGSGR